MYLKDIDDIRLFHSIMLKRGCWKIIELKRNPIMVKPSDISIHGYCMCLLFLEHSRLNWELRKSNIRKL